VDHPERNSDAPTTDENQLAYTPPPVPAQAAQIDVDDSKTMAHYANFCRLSGSPEELLMDFGLNPQPTGETKQPIVVTQRVVTGWHTAKRLLHVLQMTVNRHEAAFGVLETDVQRRVGRP
jgi:hypothetical protein